MAIASTVRGTDSPRERAPAIHLALGTISFLLSFAAWGLVSAFAPAFRARFELSGSQTGLLIAVPILLGALARIPLGMLADRFGGRALFAVLMVAVAIPVALLPEVGSFQALLGLSFLVGFAGASFAVGAAYVARWSSPERQGTALGIFALGNAGQSLAVFLGPVAAGIFGWANVFRGVAVLLAAWGVVFGIVARDAPRAGAPPKIGAMVTVMRRERLAWALAALYGLTFGGFIAFAVYLPTLLRDDFGLRPAQAGLRAAGFVVLATAMRPLGGWLSDRIGGARVLAGTLVGIIPFALLLGWVSMLPFTVGALGCAALLGVGNGAIFKLVPELFPGHAGTVMGLVGAVGGLGGFFPPLLLGVFRDTYGKLWPGFVLLALTAFALWRLDVKALLPQEEARAVERSPEWARRAERLRAGAWATMATAILVASILVGSRNLRHFDPALVIYTFGSVFAAWGVVYHYRVWISKPPTEVYWHRGWEAFFRGGVRGLGRAARLALSNIVAQTFIWRRSPLRWWMHQMIFWGCVLAAAITFPLVFGWLHFTTAPGDQTRYVVHAFGIPVLTFELGTVLAWLLFHALDIAAFLVLGGIALAMLRRMRERGAQALQTFSRDLFPLFLLVAISVTGLALTVSTMFLRGTFYSFLANLHAITVIAALLFLPFGKFFHIFQRPAQLGVKLYLDEGARGEGAICARCGERFASRAQIDDLALVLRRVGFDYRMEGRAAHWQAVCPPCKRRSLAVAQLSSLRRNGSGKAPPID